MGGQISAWQASQKLLLDPAAHLANIEQPVAFTEAVGQFLRASLVG